MTPRHVTFTQLVYNLITAVMLQAARDVTHARNAEIRQEAEDFILSDGYYLAAKIDPSIDIFKFLEWARLGCPLRPGGHHRRINKGDDYSPTLQENRTILNKSPP